MADATSNSNSTPALLGIEIGGTKLQIVLGDSSGVILKRYRHTVDRDKGGAGIRELIHKSLVAVQRAAPLKAIGVGFGGPVDRDSGQICCSHQIEGWSEFPLRSWLETIGGVPVQVENDANTAALGEALRGAGVGSNPVFYVTLGSGVGGGLVVGDSIYHGAKPGEAEIGHLRLNLSGDTVESLCSGWAVDARIRRTCEDHPDTMLARLTAGQTAGQAVHLAAAIQHQDRIAREILEDTARSLAFGLSHATHLFHPEAIILGGGLSKVGELLCDAVRRHLASFIMTAFQPGPRILAAALGDDAVPVGALLLAGKSLRRVDGAE
jgi:glucokinase